ncbi:WD repeat- and FYVE domain-containing protein 4 isoform X3 [Conger conger]|uniref:WD repeat- and FYVE domain-containing protein 4 isoform X3 n=1 Tax=Conger conger TaxID=82655 RepID=UPI002A5A8D65|nr:WD repeat- and FYVE domain-containing protein 4 isoform X3 [Conger conger]
MDERSTQTTAGSDSAETPGAVPGLKRDGAPPGGLPKSGSESALRDRLALLERNTRRPVGEREEAVLHVLPLFIELFQSGSAGEDLNLQVLAAQSAEIVVLHVQQKLSEKPAEEARYEVELFFRRNAEVRANKGWLLLQCLALLSAGDSETVTTIIRSGLPAALIKCLYLFVSLPPRKDGGVEEGVKGSFQEVFTQVLLQLCREVQCVEEVVETQELQCLIIALTSLWDQCSCAWRRHACRVLRAVSAAQTKNTVPALQAKNCMKICIQNLLKIPESVPGPVLAEVAVGVFGFVRDSYPSNPALFHEFENNEGYTVLQGIMSRCEEGVTSADLQALEEFLGLIASLTLCGKAELKVALCVNNPQPPGFKFDPVLTKGSSVKNLTAFRILQSSFLRSGNAHTCAQVLLAVRDIWSWDKANFFLLEWTLQSLAQLGECVWRKPAAVHGPFFRLLETVVLQLNYIPHEALRKLQAAFLQSGPSPFAVATLASYRTLCARSGLFCEVLCDSGVLDLLLGHLRKRAKVLRKAGITGAAVQSGEESCEKDLVRNMLDVVAVLALKSVKNTVAIRDCGMIPYIKIFLDEEQLRSPTLILLEQLSVINPEEYMSITIGALCSSTHTELALKRDLLQSVLKVLESPNSWNAFRTAGGFDGVLSLLVDMEGALRAGPGGVWASLCGERVRELVLLGLHTVALAVHLHPVNAHAFHTSQQHAKMADALLQLGCFCQDPDPGRNRDDDPGRNRDDDPGRNRDDDPGRNRDDDPGRNRDDDPGRNRDDDPGRNRDGDPARNHDYDPGRNRDDDPSRNCDDDPDPDCSRTFQQFVEAAETPGSSLPAPLRDCVRLLSFLDRFAMGTFFAMELPELPESLVEQEHSSAEVDSLGSTRSTASSVVSVSSDPGRRSAFDQTILHPGAVCVIMTLLPKISSPTHTQLVAELQLAVANHVQSLVRWERNRQIMCEAGLLLVLLEHCQGPLGSSTHPLHLPVVRVFEKLASQSISHVSLRKFLCLGNPFLCGAENDLPPPLKTDAAHVPNGHRGEGSAAPGGQEKKPSGRELKHSFSLLNRAGGAGVPHHRTVSLVSMTSPRSLRPHRLSVSPSFVEFDMSDSGFGCLFLPSLATVKGVSADSISTGGVGSDCRGFPPSAGLSFSCWFLIGRFSSACESHPIRLLTVVRHLSRAEQQFVCLSVCIAAPDGCLVVSTEEEPYQFLDMMEPEVHTPTSLPSTVRFKCAKHLIPDQWHHLSVVLAKDIKKSCHVTAYLNGKMVNTAKMKYIQPFPGQCVSMDPAAVIDVCAVIGTPSLWKQQASLIWRVGPAYLWEEALTPESVEVMYSQGTKYLGNYLSLCLPAEGPDSVTSPIRIMPEERISFGINPAVSSITTVTEIRDQYNEVDSRLIAKEMGITSRDNSTPVFLARNVAQHLSGTSRTIGAALVGRFGVRTFVSTSAADSFLFVGGPAVVLSLVAMATDDSSLYAAAKVLLSVLSMSPSMEREMNRTHGYQLLAFLLKTKSQLIGIRTFQLILAIVGTVELGSIRNLTAFRDILCDFDVWQNAPDNLDMMVLNHFADILISSDDGRSAAVLHSLGVMVKLLFLLNEPSLTCHKTHLIATVLQRLLQGHFSARDVCRIGLFLVYTLLPPSLNENTIFSGIVFDISSQALSQTPARTVWIRNQLLEMLFSLVSPDSTLPQKAQEEVFLALGPDWFLLFMQSHLHSSTVTLALRLLTRLLSFPSILPRFRDGMSPGTLLENMADEASAIMDNLRPQACTQEACCPCPGFQVLQRLLVSHVATPEVYMLLAGLLLQKSSYGAVTGQVDLDGLLQQLIDSTDEGLGLQLCSDAAQILLELVKVIISKPDAGSEGSWEMQFPGSVMQFFCLVHSLHPRDPLWSSPNFLSVLAATVFPPPDPNQTPADPSLPNGVATPEPPLPPPATHPARKQVCDFMRILLMDSLINIAAKNKLHPFLLLLEFSPDSASQEQKQSFQTEVLEFLMDIVHMTCQVEGQATHVARDDVKAHGDRPVGNATLVGNVVFFTKKLVEKLYEGMFLAEPEKILVFIAEQIAVVMEKGSSQREKTVSVLYNSANRALLYFLSRRRQTGADLQAVVEALSVLQQQWDVLMATYNANTTFLTCLLHCLLILRSGRYPEGFGWETHKKQPKKIWSHLLPHKNSQPSAPVVVPNSAEVESELRGLVESTWSRLMAERRHDLEETYKMEVSAKTGARGAPVSLTDVSPLWEETALNAWQLFIDSQKKKLSNSQQKKTAALSSVLRSAQKKLGKATGCTVEEYLMCMEAHRKTSQEMFERLLKNHVQTVRCEQDRLGSRWLRVEEELLRERGLFGPGPGVLLTQGWVQDAAEGPNRMRPRIRPRAPRRSKKFPASSPGLYGKWTFIEENRGVAEASDTDSEHKILCEAGQEVLDCDQLTFFPSLSEAYPLSDDFAEQCTETHLILQELSPTEKVKSKLCVVIVSGHIVTEGVLLFGKSHFYICEGFTLSPSGDVCCKNHHPTSVRDSFICSMFLTTPSSETTPPSCRRYAYEEVKDAHFARFLLEDNALEIFMRSGQSTFLVFQNKEHRSAFKWLCSIVPSLKGRTVTDARKTAGAEKAALLKWQRGEMSNFEYLMHLNTMAGRTYNDLMQYPVFPWVLADYDSETLDLSSPATFRDLSKPMGAQTDKRKEKFIQRYNEVENNDGDLSAQCHYCTHYSSAIIVSSMLVRMEPFSQTFLSLQGGSFDVADRMFYSVKKEWESASRDNMSDVRELIPEFYYLPDFLLNSNGIELGCLQDGTPLGDVILPPWAKGDPQEFIRVHREALESEYVSSQLHLWVDLIFGCKQLGQAALEAVNTFHPYFYAETLDSDCLRDPLKKSTILGFVNNFGQIPRQLFTKPHPARNSRKNSKDQLGPSHGPPFFCSLGRLKPSVQPVKELIRGPVGHMVCGEKDILVVEKNKLLIPPLWNAFFSWGFHDNTFAYGNYSTEKNFAVCESPSDWGASGCAACPNPSTVVTGGASSVLCVWDIALAKDKLQHMRLRQVLYGHTDAVTCVEASQAYGVIVSGSSDRTCILWDLQELSYITQLPGHAASVSALAINDLTGEIASCAGAHLYLWTMKGHLLSSLDTSFGPEGAILCCCFTQVFEWDPRNVIVTGCADGIVRVWKNEYTAAQLPSRGEGAPRSPGAPRPGAAERAGKEWERHLVLTQELNRSQTVSRRRYKNNPAVTALAISRDHSSLFVGDAWGRVFSWTSEG